MEGASSDVFCVACEMLDGHHGSEVERRGTWDMEGPEEHCGLLQVGLQGMYVSWTRAMPLSCETMPSRVASHSNSIH